MTGGEGGEPHPGGHPADGPDEPAPAPREQVPAAVVLANTTNAAMTAQYQREGRQLAGDDGDRRAHPHLHRLPRREGDPARGARRLLPGRRRPRRARSGTSPCPGRRPAARATGDGAPPVYARTRSPVPPPGAGGRGRRAGRTRRSRPPGAPRRRPAAPARAPAGCRRPAPPPRRGRPRARRGSRGARRAGRWPARGGQARTQGVQCERARAARRRPAPCGAPRPRAARGPARCPPPAARAVVSQARPHPVGGAALELVLHEQRGLLQPAPGAVEALERLDRSCSAPSAPLLSWGEDLVDPQRISWARARKASTSRRNVRCGRSANTNDRSSSVGAQPTTATTAPGSAAASPGGTG